MVEGKSTWEKGEEENDSDSCPNMVMIKPKTGRVQIDSTVYHKSNIADQSKSTVLQD